MFIALKLITIVLLSATVFSGYVILYIKRVHGLPYTDTSAASAVKTAWFLGLVCFYGSLLWNVIVIDREKRRRPGRHTLFFQYFQTKLALQTALAIIVCSLTIYIGQRAKWMGEGNANLTAKEYYVAGQVLNGFRSLLTTFIHPEIPVMAPLNWVQQKIYDQGVRYLPKEDGEIAIWQNSWFLYHYSKLGRKTLAAKPWEPSAGMIALLDEEWFCLKVMATKTFSDRQMEEEHFYRDYVSLAMSYTLKMGFYSGPLVQSANRIAQMPEHMNRVRLISRWLRELHEKWQGSEKMGRFLEQHPKLEAMWQFVLLDALERIIQGEIYAREFDCESEFVKGHVKIRKEFAEPENGKPAYQRMKSKVQGKRLYSMAINSDSPRSTKYVLQNYCGYELAGMEDNSDRYRRAKNEHITPAESAERSAKNNYMDEIKILEEIFHK